MSRNPVAVLLLSIMLVTPACSRTSDGVPVAGTETPRGAPPAATGTPYPGNSDDSPLPGIVPPEQTPAPVGAPCVPADLPPVRMVAEVSDPAAPTVTVGVPEGWSMSSGDGDPEGARLEGPDGMTAVVTIAPTTLDPEAAFRERVDALTEDATISTVSTLPGELCGYSGQELMGNLSDGAESVEYRDRLVHVGTTGQAYLIVVHVEAPAGTTGFDEAATLLTGDFEIGLP